MRRSDIESVYKIPKVASRATTVSTKRPKTKRPKKSKRKLKKSRATMMSAAEMSSGRRTLFFFNVPAWITDYEELIMLFRQVRDLVFAF